MSAEIIDGKAVAAQVREEVAREVADAGPASPGLATVLVGDDPASAVYVRMKREDSAEVGIESFHHEPGGGRGARGARRAAARAERGRSRATASCSSSRCPTTSTRTSSSR